MIVGFLQDIVRGAREFRRSSAADVDSIEHSRDAKARATKVQRSVTIEGQK